MKRFAKWTAAILAVMATILIGLFLFSPTTRLAMAILIAAALNPGPPAISQGVITSEDWPNFEEGSQKITNALQSTFPGGTKEEVLKSALLGQGFRPIDPPPVNCIKPEEFRYGRTSDVCWTQQQAEVKKRTLEYRWGSGVCGQTISVNWSIDEQGDLTRVQGRWHGVCL